MNRPTRLLLVSSVAALALVAAALPGVSPAPAPWWQSGGASRHGAAQRGADAAGPVDIVSPAVLANTWWKLKATAKGVSVSPVDGTTLPAGFHTTAYMHLTLAPAPPGPGVSVLTPLYNYDMWTETAPGIFGSTFGNPFSVGGKDKDGNETVVADTFMGFAVPASNEAVACNFSGRFSIKMKDGAFKSATLKTLAGNVTQSTLDTVSGLAFFGSMKITGATIDPSKLPFSPP